MTRKDYVVLAQIFIKSYESVWLKAEHVNKVLAIAMKELEETYPNFDKAKFHAFIVKGLNGEKVA